MIPGNQKPKKENPVFMVGVFNHPLSVRRMGWFASEREANLAVKNNLNNIHEDYYRFAVVEKVFPGFYPFCPNHEAMWYQWDNQSKKYIRKSRINEVVKQLGLVNLVLK